MRNLIEAKIEERGWSCRVYAFQSGEAYGLVWPDSYIGSRFSGRELMIAQARVEDVDEFLNEVASECEKENFDPVSGTFYAEAAE